MAQIDHPVALRFAESTILSLKMTYNSLERDLNERRKKRG